MKTNEKNAKTLEVGEEFSMEEDSLGLMKDSEERIFFPEIEEGKRCAASPKQSNMKENKSKDVRVRKKYSAWAGWFSSTILSTFMEC